MIFAKIYKRRRSPLLLLLLAALLSGCGKQKSDSTNPAEPDKQSQKASKLTVLVVDDPGISSGIKLLRGEWAERSGGEIEIQESSSKELLAAESLSADLVVYPSRYVGTLVMRNVIRPIRKSVLESDDVALDDIFPLVRNHILRFGDDVYGLTLGEAPLMLATGKEEADQLWYWDEVLRPLETKNSPLPYPLAVEFLLRGSAYARQGDQPVRWFNVQTMQPQLEGEPFAKALKQMANRDNDETNGQLKLGWPQAATDSDDVDPPIFLPLPHTRRTYNGLLSKWEQAEKQKEVAYLGFAGQLASVSRSTRNSSSAFKLLRWLTSAEISSQLSPRSAATMWFRQSQQSKASRWLSAAENSDQVAQFVGQLLTSADAQVLPRIPGIDEYLKALDTEIQQAIESKDSSEQVTSRLVAAWNKITDRYGRDQQRAAYRRHLGLDE